MFWFHCFFFLFPWEAASWNGIVLVPSNPETAKHLFPRPQRTAGTTFFSSRTWRLPEWQLFLSGSRNFLYGNLFSRVEASGRCFFATSVRPTVCFDFLMAKMFCGCYFQFTCHFWPRTHFSPPVRATPLHHVNTSYPSAGVPSSLTVDDQECDYAPVIATWFEGMATMVPTISVSVWRTCTRASSKNASEILWFFWCGARHTTAAPSFNKLTVCS